MGKKYFLHILLSIAGFAAALALNILVPQISPDVTIKTYTAFGHTIDMNDAYRAVTAAIIILYAVMGVCSSRNEIRADGFAKRARFRFAAGIALALWDLFGTKLQWLPQPFFPGPAQIIESFLMEGGYILSNTLYSLRLYAVSFAIGVILGVGTGVLTGWFPKVNYWVAPVLNITGVIPSVAWMPFALTLFPTPFAAAVFLIVICTWFPIASLTAEGVRSTPRTQFEAARTLGGNEWYLVFHVAIPHAMPQIFTGITTANAFAFVTLVMAEMLGQPGGLGYYINASKVWSAYYKVFAAILIMAVLFSVIVKLTSLVEGRVLRWQRGLHK